MSQYLTTGKFRWMEKKKFDKLDLNKYTDDSQTSLILEVDLEYPKELHDLHNDFRLAPEQVQVNENMLSDYCKQRKDKSNVSIVQVHKLIPTLNNKEKYVLHYRNLQLYLSLVLN